tara:strand:- start:164 stop:673 length:510 start_codon:yes stop_codon:yes gene_type:complete
LSPTIFNPYRYAVASETQYCQSVSSEPQPLGIWYGGGSRGGVRFQAGHPVIGQTMTQCTLYLLKVGSPTGTAYVRIYEMSSNTLQHTFGSIDVSTLTTSSAPYVFDTGEYVPSLDDILCCVFTGGDASNYPAGQKDGASGYPSQALADYPSEAWRTASGQGYKYCVSYT